MSINNSVSLHLNIYDISATLDVCEVRIITADKTRYQKQGVYVTIIIIFDALFIFLPR